MLSAIKTGVVILNLVVNHYNYSTPSEFIEMVGYATNEVICTEAPKEIRHKMAACSAHCNTQTYWFSNSDIMEDIPECREIMGWKVLDDESVVDMRDYNSCVKNEDSSLSCQFEDGSCGIYYKDYDVKVTSCDGIIDRINDSNDVVLLEI